MNKLKRIINYKNDLINSINFFNPINVLKKYFILLSIVIICIDFIYKTILGLSYAARNKCILYNSLPKWLFLFYEHIIELSFIVITGIFIAKILDKYLYKINFLIPKNPLTAFLYASILPLCSCSVIPLSITFKKRISFATMITFITAAPLLNPYIIILSGVLLGAEYALLRITSSFIIAVTTGTIASLFFNENDNKNIYIKNTCSNSQKCIMNKNSSVFNQTFDIFKKIFPYLIIAGLISIILELYQPQQCIKELNNFNSGLKTIIATMLGAPIYLCNGADIIFLKPLIHSLNLSIGTVLAFSLSSTSICISSFILLIKFLGKKITIIIYIFIITNIVIFSILTDLISNSLIF